MTYNHFLPFIWVLASSLGANLSPNPLKVGPDCAGVDRRIVVSRCQPNLFGAAISSSGPRSNQLVFLKDIL